MASLCEPSNVSRWLWKSYDFSWPSRPPLNARDESVKQQSRTAFGCLYDALRVFASMSYNLYSPVIIDFWWVKISSELYTSHKSPKKRSTSIGNFFGWIWQKLTRRWASRLTQTQTYSNHTIETYIFGVVKIGLSEVMRTYGGFSIKFKKKHLEEINAEPYHFWRWQSFTHLANKLLKYLSEIIVDFKLLINPPS